MLSNCNAIISDSTLVRVARVSPVCWERPCRGGSLSGMLWELPAGCIKNEARFELWIATVIYLPASRGWRNPFLGRCKNGHEEIFVPPRASATFNLSSDRSWSYLWTSWILQWQLRSGIKSIQWRWGPHWAHFVLALLLTHVDFHLEEIPLVMGAEEESVEPVLLCPSSWVGWSGQKLCEQDCQVKGHHQEQHTQVQHGVFFWKYPITPPE